MMQVISLHFEEISSTNAYAKQHCSEFSKEAITCISAEEQTRGYGRYGRSWHSPRGQNIYATFAFRLPLKTVHLTSLAQVMTLSFANVLLSEGLHPKVKWPNDVQLNQKKIAGVLCETAFHKDRIDIFCGIGINVNMTSDQFVKIDQPATSLRVATDRVWDRDTLLQKLQQRFARDLEIFQQKGFAAFHAQFENLLAYKGQTVRCFDGKKEWLGICHSLTNDGQLNLSLPNGEMHTIVSGDITQE